MLLGSDFTSGHALCVSAMALSSGGLYEGRYFGASPLENRTCASGLVVSNWLLPVHRVTQASPGIGLEGSKRLLFSWCPLVEI